MEKLFFPKKLNVVHTKNLFILKQLQLEEALLRLDNNNWCIINESTTPAIVLGISSKPDEMIHAEILKKEPIPIIRRYSGGGTVSVNENTFFISFIFSKTSDLCFPEPIMRWSAKLFEKALKIPGFHLRENDYVIGDKKCAGNAQCIQKDRFSHHSSFLWDFDKKQMNYLLYPPKTPSYRKKRDHSDFLCKLKEFSPSKMDVINSLKKFLHKNSQVYDIPYQKILPLQKISHRKATLEIK